MNTIQGIIKYPVLNIIQGTTKNANINNIIKIVDNTSPKAIINSFILFTINFKVLLNLSSKTFIFKIIYLILYFLGIISKSLCFCVFGLTFSEKYPNQI